MKKIYLIIFATFISGALKAQNNFHEVTVGAGAGPAAAYTGTQLPKTTFVWFINAGYYPTPFLNINLERQAGTLSGASATAYNPKSFTNNYSAVILNGELKFGQFFDPQDNKFLLFAKNISIGTGYGLMSNSITNEKLTEAGGTTYIKNSVGMVPFKLGYELTLISGYNEPLLKLDLSGSFNYTIGAGLDGYNFASRSFKFYNYYAIGLRYVISLSTNYQTNQDGLVW